MPFVSGKDRRGLESMLRPPAVAPEVQDDPTFGETFSAAVGLTIDENLSISSLLNKEMYQERRVNAINLINQGIVDPESYQYGDGRFDFNKLSRDLEDTDYSNLIKTDRVLRDERNTMLARRRAYAESVLAEGPGTAQFVGSATAFMLDPINIATMPIATVTTASKGLTAFGTALRTAGTTAALTAGTEAAIQPFVYAHKEDIESPYSAQDAIAAIVTAAAGGAAIGAVTGGIAGYFRNARTKTSEALTEEPAITNQDSIRRAEVGEPTEPPYTVPEQLSQADRSLEEIADYIDALNAARDPTPIRIMDEEYELWLRGEFDTLEGVKKSTVKKLEQEQRKLSKSKKMVGWVKEKGGLNKKIFAAEGIDPEVFKKGRFPPGFWRAGDQGMTPDMLAERLLDDPDISVAAIPDLTSPVAFTANDAFDWVETVINNPNMYRDPTVQARIDDLDARIKEVEEAPVGDPLEQVYRDASRQRIIDEAEYLREWQSKMDASNEATRLPEDYPVPEEPRPVDMAVIDRERELMQLQGTQESYDLAMEAYNQLPTNKRKVFVEGEEVSADTLIKEIDDQLEDINNLIRCVRGE
jgi:hypothetical protein